MREYPVGSVCVILDNVDSEFRHKECIIVEGLALRNTSYKGKEVGKHERYVITIQGFGDKKFHASREQLRIKKLPGQLQSWLAEKMDKLFTPNPYIVLEEL